MESAQRHQIALDLQHLRAELESATSVLSSLLKIYGPEAGSPSRLPFPILVSVAYAHMTATATFSCKTCRAEYGTGTGGVVDAALLPLGDTLIQFAQTILKTIPTDANRGWLPDCIVTDMAQTNLRNSGDEGAIDRNFAVGANEAALNYLNCLLIEAGMRIADLTHSTFRSFDKKPYVRLSVRKAFEFTDIRSGIHKREDTPLLVK